MAASGEDEIRNGWTLEKDEILYHFEHFSLDDADLIRDKKVDYPSVVETINWTLAEEGTMVHYNKYFTWCFDAAIAKAVEIELLSKEVAEEVVCVRIARDDELETYYNASEYFEELEPLPATRDPPWKGKAVSDEDLSNLN
tara:strand:+ start:118 stop:540 length:423 start_codon:yes stop_codon:yes gene_type:complete